MAPDLKQYLDQKFRDVDEAVAATEQRLVSRVDRVEELVEKRFGLFDRILAGLTLAIGQRLDSAMDRSQAHSTAGVLDRIAALERGEKPKGQ